MSNLLYAGISKRKKRLIIMNKVISHLLACIVHGTLFRPAGRGFADTGNSCPPCMSSHPRRAPSPRMRAVCAEAGLVGAPDAHPLHACVPCAPEGRSCSRIGGMKAADRPPGARGTRGGYFFTHAWRTDAHSGRERHARARVARERDVGDFRARSAHSHARVPHTLALCGTRAARPSPSSRGYARAAAWAPAMRPKIRQSATDVPLPGYSP